jgi:hypothetical protein
MAATPTTLDALQLAFVAAISAIVPRYPSKQDRWKFADGDRKPSAGMRWYRLEWDSRGYTRGGFMGSAANLGGVDTSVQLSVFVDYGGISREVAKRLAEDDNYQLRDVLSDLKPTTAGLLYLEAEDWDFVGAADNNSPQVVHTFAVRYMKARAQ